MPLSSVQKGAIGQFSFLAAALITGKGQVEVYTPAADNEGRDAEIRRHLKRSPGIGVQIKVAFATVTIGPHHRQPYLEIRFDLPEDRVQNDPRLWYFLAAYDPRQLRFIDPVFFVPSQVFHRLARRANWKGKARFVMFANLGPEADDKWSRYRLNLRDLGRQLLKAIDSIGIMAGAGSLPISADAVVLALPKRSAGTKRGLRAA